MPLLISPLIVGCSFFGTPPESLSPESSEYGIQRIQELEGDWVKRILKLDEIPQAEVGPGISPIYEAAEIKKIWRPPKVNESGDLIGGHYIYIVLDDGNWVFE